MFSRLCSMEQVSRNIKALWNICNCIKVLQNAVVGRAHLVYLALFLHLVVRLHPLQMALCFHTLLLLRFLACNRFLWSALGSALCVCVFLLAIHRIEGGGF